MNRSKTKKIVFNGLMIALVFLATKFLSFPGPIPPGYINMGDAVIMITAVIFGRNSGFIAGSIGSCLADIAYPAYMYAPFTFIIKGVEGYVMGVIADLIRKKVTGKGGNFIVEFILNIVTFIIGASIMVTGYFFTEAFVLGFIDKTLGYAAAVINLPLNILQGAISIAVAIPLSLLLRGGRVRKIIE